MNRFGAIRLAITVTILLILSSCQKFDRITVKYVDNQLVFSFEELGKEIVKDKQFILYDIAVSRQDCLDNCVAWELMRDEKYFDTNDYPLEHKQITYGATPEAMITKTKPATLTTGKYSVIANVALIVDNKFEKAQRLFQNFELSSSDNNQLHIRIID